MHWAESDGSGLLTKGLQGRAELGLAGEGSWACAAVTQPTCVDEASDVDGVVLLPTRMSGGGLQTPATGRSGKDGIPRIRRGGGRSGRIRGRRAHR